MAPSRLIRRNITPPNLQGRAINSGLKILLSGLNVSQDSRCALATAIEYATFYDFSTSFAAPIDKACLNVDMKAALNTYSPLLGKYVEALDAPPRRGNPTRAHCIFVSEVYAPSWWSRNTDYEVMNWFRTSCSEYAGTKTRNKLDDLRSQATGLLALAAQANDEAKKLTATDALTSADPAATAFLQTIISSQRVLGKGQFSFDGMYLSNIDSVIKIVNQNLNEVLPQKEKLYQKNVQTCTDVFGSDYIQK